MLANFAAVFVAGLLIGAFVQEWRHRKKERAAMRNAIVLQSPDGKIRFSRLRVHLGKSQKKFGKKIFPFPHAGGRPRVEPYDWAYKLETSNGLTREQSWQKYQSKYVKPGLDLYSLESNKKSFYDAMKYRDEHPQKPPKRKTQQRKTRKTRQRKTPSE